MLDSRYRSNYLVLGASGDLAFKKVYPALFGLYKNQWLSGKFHIVGYARSVLNLDDFKKRISSKIKIATQQDKEFLSQFLDRCFYVSGQYNNAESYKLLNIKLEELEKSPSESPVHRVFYMALPPSVFADASAGLKEHVYLPSGTNRIVIEKPFGKDLDSSRELSTVISKDWEEESIYRIDHYLGKEMVKNLMVLRYLCHDADLPTSSSVQSGIRNILAQFKSHSRKRLALRAEGDISTSSGLFEM